MNELEINNSIFENIKHIDEIGNEYWLARELQVVLEYSQWRRFESVISEAMIACKKSNNNIYDHFANVGKMVDIGSKTRRKLNDYKLSRYACYLIAQSCDNRKKAISLAKTYFAIKTHYIVGKNVRNTIKKNGGTMLEDLETPSKSLKELEKETKLLK